jgi:hypothetical protein
MEISRLFRHAAKMSRAALRRAGFDITRYPPFDKRQELEMKIALLTRNTVTCGMFTGLILPEGNSWGEGDRASKLLGLYEKELEPSLKDVECSEPGIVINVGCADGFYALGLARLIPNAKVVAYDIDQQAQEVCRVGRRLNNLDGDFEIRGYCSAEELQDLTQMSNRPFALIDCEGGERELLLSTSYDYANTRMIVECHDFLDRRITSELINKFSKTHKIELIEQGGKNPFTSEITTGWAENDLWLIVSERRPERMHWLYLTPQLTPQPRTLLRSDE